jgi:peptidoglycan/LPS O-acetylase OafA/YrhL
VKKQSIDALTSLRFFFALAVFGSHLGFLQYVDNPWIKSVFQNVLSEGYLGVSFFFILSGFILAYNYADTFESGWKGGRNFIVARVARIYPLHILTFLLSIPLWWLGEPLRWIQSACMMVMNLLLVQSYLPIQKIYFSFNAPSWSISDELFFYILTPFLLYLFQRWIRQGKRFGYLLMGAFIVSLITLMSVVPENYQHALFYVHPLFRMCDFVLGILLFLVTRNVKRIPYSTFFQFMSLSLFIASVCFNQWVPQVYRYSIYYWPSMLCIVYTFTSSDGFISKLTERKWLIYLGEVSFGFYMFHLLVIKYMLLIFPNIQDTRSTLYLLMAMFLFTFLLSMLSFHYFETPARKWVKVKFSRKDK